MQVDNLVATLAKCRSACIWHVSAHGRIGSKTASVSGAVLLSAFLVIFTQTWCWPPMGHQVSPHPPLHSSDLQVLQRADHSQGAALPTGSHRVDPWFRSFWWQTLIGVAARAGAYGRPSLRTFRGGE